MQMAFPEMDDEIDLDDDFYKNCFIFNGHSAHMKNDFRNIYGATKNNK